MSFEPDNSAEQPAPAHQTAPLPDFETLLATEPPTAAEVVENTIQKLNVRILVAAQTDIGCVRTNNEDSYGYDQNLGLYIVCDGMGGMASGEIASALAVSTAMASFASTANSDSTVSTRLHTAIHAANQAVWQFGQQPEHRGMGTTLVAIASDGDSLIIGNVGDSRAYMLKNGKCMQLTVDHSYLNELIRNGTLSIESAQTADLGGMAAAITRAIGASEEVLPDFFSITPAPSDIILLASDGLTRYMSPEELLDVFSKTEIQTAPQVLIDIAKQRGGIDNITCIVLQAAAAS